MSDATAPDPIGPDDIAVTERVAIYVPNAERAEVARRLLDTPLGKEDPTLVRTFSGGFAVPGPLFDQAYPEPGDADRKRAVPSSAHPAGKARKEAGKAAKS